MEKMSKAQFMHRVYEDRLKKRRVEREVDIYIHKKACRMRAGKKGMERFE